jgi:RNA polymerase sigma-70 factor (ECF subfamily)
MKNEQYHWSKFLKGDNQALGELYSELFEPLVFISIFYVKNNEAARDIVSDLFVQLITTSLEERKRKWVSVNSCKAYLTIAVKNKSIDFMRKVKNQAAISEQIPLNLTENSADFSDDILEVLSSAEQEIFQLHLDGFKNEEIAQKQKLTEKTVRNKLSISRKKMEKVFKSFLFLFA